MQAIETTDLALLTDAAREAGWIASRYHGKTARIWDKPDGQGPVTEADLAVDGMLRARLMAARPDYGWLSEETEDDPARLATTRQFIIDPIDGTRAFVEGGRDWAHSLAIAENGRVVAGVVYLPMRDLLYTAAAGEGAFLNDRPLRVTATGTLDGADLLCHRQMLEPEFWATGTPPPVRRHFRSSLAYRLSLVAEGRFDGMMTLRPTWDWDIAAGVLIVDEAGGTTTDRRGRRPRFNTPGARNDGIIAAGATVGADLLAALAPEQAGH